MVEAKAVDIDELHAQSKIRPVVIEQLQVDRSYQRDPSQRLVELLSEDYDIISAELLLISDRGDRNGGDVQGGLFIVNGQHRTLAARKAGMTKLDARVVDLTEVDDPARIEAKFRLRTNVRVGDKSLERFKAQVRSRDPESLAIVQILAKFDTQINEVPTAEAGINSVAGVERLYRQDEGALLAEVLQVIRDAYGHVGGKAASASTLAGLAWFVIKHGQESDRDRFIEKLHEAGPAALHRRGITTQAAMGGALWMNYYRAMVDFYNDRLHDKNKLEWRLRGASGRGGNSIASTSWSAG